MGVNYIQFLSLYSLPKLGVLCHKSDIKIRASCQLSKLMMRKHWSLQVQVSVCFLSFLSTQDWTPSQLALLKYPPSSHCQDFDQDYYFILFLVGLAILTKTIDSGPLLKKFTLYFCGTLLKKIKFLQSKLYPIIESIDLIEFII